MSTDPKRTSVATEDPPPPTDHQVPSGGGTVAEPLGPVEPARSPTAAEEARTLAAGNGTASLSTIAVDPAGYPFGSVAPYALDDEGAPILCISTMAEHTRNLTADPRASLLVAEAAPSDEAVAVGRLTLVGDARRLDGPAADEARERWLAAHPEGGYAHFGDFHLWRIQPRAVRWIGGFGRMDWVDADSWSAARPDPVRPTAASAVAHLNADHGDALVAMAQVFCGQLDATAALAVRIDRYGIDLQITTPRGPAVGRVGFPDRLGSADDLRKACVERTRAARARLA